MVRKIALICAYNEEKRIKSVVNKTFRYVDAVLVVNDGSKDNTLREVKKTKAVILSHKTNKGKGEALKTGFRYIKNKPYDIIVLLDADGQHDPADIPKLLKELDKGYDIVIGTRRKRGTKMPLIRRFTNFTTSLIISSIVGQKIKDSQSGFRVLRSKVIRAVDLVSKKYEVESELLVKASRKNYKIGSAPIKTIYGKEVSAISPLKDTYRFVRLIFRSFGW
jgi:glycosyltransferase involved in cell wall biosynthesis